MQAFLNSPDRGPGRFGLSPNQQLPLNAFLPLDALQRAHGFLRRRLASKLRLRNTPQLRFHHDRSVQEGERMDRLIQAARRRDSHD